MVIQIKDMENYGKSVPVRIPFMDIDPAEDGTMACTAYEYGMALAEAIAPHLSNEKNYSICVEASSGALLQQLQAFPHTEGYEIGFVNRAMFRGLVFQKRTEKIPDRYLIIVDPARNLNNYYKMTDLGGGEWGATTGRIGERQGRNRRARNVVIPQKHRDYEFGIKLLEKLMNGYQDKSECHSIKIIRSKNPEATVSGIDDEKVADLIERLMRYAQEAIRENYTVSYTDVTEEMIRQANTEIQKIRESRDIRELNAHLTELMHIIPRRIDGRGDAGVKSMLAESMDQLADILEREKELLDIMEGQILVNQETKKEEENIIDRMGITIRQATPEEYKEAESALDGGLQTKLKAVYRVINKATQAKFDEYIKEENPDRKIFWHGSKNRNWFSILQKGLLLNPDAAITGKMFGQGIYFAQSAMKSWGYTSSPVAKYTNEYGKCAFMALFDTAYGKPFEVYDHHLFSSGFDYTDLKKHAPDCNCVHAKKDKGMLYADEIIFYREDQVTVKYLCEFDV